MVRSSRTMPWLARRPTFERTVDFLTELPIWIVELILRMSLNKTNYKALKYTIGSGNVARMVQREVLTLINDIVKEDKFVRRELSFDIQVSHLVETELYYNYLWKGDAVAMTHKLTDDRKNYTDTGLGENEGMAEEIQMITQGYDCIQFICIHKESIYKDLVETYLRYYKKPKVMILDFWKMYPHARENNVVQQIISALRLVKENKKSKSYKHNKLSFTVELVFRKTGRKNMDSSHEDEVRDELDTFIHLELIALDMRLLQHVDSAYTHVATGTTHPHQVTPSHNDCPRYQCRCREGRWRHGNSGNMSSWSLITVLGTKWNYTGGRRWVIHPLSVNQKTERITILTSSG